MERASDCSTVLKVCVREMLQSMEHAQSLGRSSPGRAWWYEQGIEGKGEKAVGQLHALQQVPLTGDQSSTCPRSPPNSNLHFKF